MESLSLMDSQCFVKIIEVNTKNIKEARLQSVLDETLTPENLTTEKFTVNDQDLEMIDIDRFYTVLDPKLSENGYCLVANSLNRDDSGTKPLYVPVNLSYQPLSASGTVPIPESLIHELTKSNSRDIDWIQIILHQHDISTQFDSENERDSANFSCDSIPNDATSSSSSSSSLKSSASSIISTRSMQQFDQQRATDGQFHCKCCQLKRGLDLSRLTSKILQKMSDGNGMGSRYYGKLRLHLLKNRPSDCLVEIDSSPRSLMKMAKEIEEDNDDDFDSEYFKNRAVVNNNSDRDSDLNSLNDLDRNIASLRTGNEEIRSEIKNIRNGFQEDNSRVSRLIEEAQLLCKDLKDLKYLDDLIFLLEGQIDNVKMKPWPFKIGALPDSHPERIANLIV